MNNQVKQNYKLTDLDVVAIIRGIRIWNSPAKKAYEFIDCGDSVRFITENEQVADYIREWIRNTGANMTVNRERDQETGNEYYMIDIETEKVGGNP